ncbi:MAG: polysaccharide biosynthesis protein, partial [Solirubrobacteraceae bacterium]
MSASEEGQSGYGAGARILSIGIASTGLLTFAYFSITSHVLGEAQAKRIDLLWSVMFVIISVIYRPIEQLLSRTIAQRRARGSEQHALRVPMLIQAGFALLFLALALALHAPLNRVFDHDEALYWVLLTGTLAYAASYFARGWLAGHERFGLFGGLVLMESLSRLCFALAVAVGIADGETAVALGIAAAPFVSLVVVPAAFAHTRSDRPRALAAPITVEEADAALAGPGAEGVQEAAAHEDLSLRRGGGFALSVSAIMLSEQALLNAAVLTVDATSKNAGLAGVVFNVLLIARAPLQLFQAIQTSLLPHLTGLETTAGHAAFAHAIRLTVLAIAGFAALVTLGLLVVGPFLMRHVLFGQHYPYKALGLALIGLGMGLHLISGALNQAALARDRARAAAACWLLAAVLF